MEKLLCGLCSRPVDKEEVVSNEGVCDSCKIEIYSSMKEFIDWLEENNYYPYRKLKNGSFKGVQAFTFSSMVEGGLEDWYFKNGDFNTEPIIIGLRECKKPPYLLHPKLNVKVVSEKKSITCYPGNSDEINEIFRQHSLNEILETIFDNTIILEIQRDVLEKPKFTFN